MAIPLIAFLVSLMLGGMLRGKGKRLPTRFGGVAVIVALLAATLIVEGPAVFSRWAPYWVGAGIVFGMGLVDDLTMLRPVTKLGFQIVAAVVFLLLLSPLVLSTPSRSWPLQVHWWVPIFFFWLVGVTNSLNLLDNMDGLTPGVGAIGALGLASAGIGSHPVLLALAGSLLGLLVYNFHPASIHLGDSGSHVVGFSLAALPLFEVTPKQFWIPVVILLVPICDTTYVTFSRLLRGVSPFQGGKDHISHRLLAAGLSEKLVAILFYGIAGLLCFLPGITRNLTD
ncbi:undecaprenyl/decaprenyl-phosphate alpha-N-acetylglucosaminyl 1-phosphate transferase [Acidobacteria bacterium AH-259-A15]|nr:undecaprenyl/decaprenyl-phosphate alpha-N-acetylglucosaminyl 1-phosphate transferase [Acidobacteria bacterium AH-259-A15]